eukprot:TRINITY_DN377_c0_g3_i1.p1 TRINITY_DN377_c0_g3~~TRINITY_DN377_c0_g3_i1.p1  ORF type:complete len:245 (+),score=74.48 TRINITY_DN377_c0_g3_i1:613-1347(+)
MWGRTDTQCRARWKEIERGKTKFQRDLREIGRSPPSESVKAAFEKLEKMQKIADGHRKCVSLPHHSLPKLAKPIEKEVTSAPIPACTSHSHISPITLPVSASMSAGSSQHGVQRSSADEQFTSGNGNARRMYMPYRSSCIVGTALFPLCGSEEDDKTSISYALLDHEPQMLEAELPSGVDREEARHQWLPPQQPSVVGSVVGEDMKPFSISGVYDSNSILSHSHILSHSSGSFGDFDVGGNDGV